MIEKRVLWAAIEDYVGLWEIQWEFGKDIEKPSTLELIEVLIKFHDLGVLEFFKCKEPYGELEKINTNIKVLLEDIINWKEPLVGSISIRVSATNKGQEYYKTLA